MMKLIRLVALTVAALVASCAEFGAQRETFENVTLPLSTRGNLIVDSKGIRWMGRGVNLHDTRSCNACTFQEPGPELIAEVKRRIDHLVSDWEVNFIRLALESYPLETGKQLGLRHYGGVLDDFNYLAEVVEIVRHAGRYPGLYVMVSLWQEPSVDSKLGVPTARTRETWRRLAAALAPFPHVLFGLVNEPRGRDADDDVRIWHSMNETVKAIREVEARAGVHPHLIAVQGTRDHGRDLLYYVRHPILAADGRNIVYETHFYNRAAKFARLVLTPAQTLPVIIGEFGPVKNGADTLMSMADTKSVIQSANAAGIPWAAWTFHMRCEPALLEDTAPNQCGVNMPLRPTEWGRLIRKAIRAGN